MSAVHPGWSIPQMELLTRTLKAIAHPTRLAIIELLHQHKRMTVTDIYTALDADQSSVSHHLSIMRDKYVLGAERKGKYIHYYLNNPVYLELMECLRDLHSQTEMQYPFV